MKLRPAWSAAAQLVTRDDSGTAGKHGCCAFCCRPAVIFFAVIFLLGHFFAASFFAPGRSPSPAVLRDNRRDDPDSRPINVDSGPATYRRPATPPARSGRVAIARHGRASPTPPSPAP